MQVSNFWLSLSVIWVGLTQICLLDEPVHLDSVMGLEMCPWSTVVPEESSSSAHQGSSAKAMKKGLFFFFLIIIIIDLIQFFFFM